MNSLKLVLLSVLATLLLCSCEENEAPCRDCAKSDTELLNKTKWLCSTNTGDVMREETLEFGTSMFTHKSNSRTVNDDGTLNMETSHMIGFYIINGPSICLFYDATHIPDICVDIPKSGGDIVLTINNDTKKFSRQ